MIHIHILRVSNDSNYLEIKVECPVGYVFNQLRITRYNVATGEDDTTINASALLSGNSTMETMQIATSAIGTDVTMYRVEFGVTATEVGLPAIDNLTGICSNVNFVYENLLDLVMNFNDCCISDADYEKMDRSHMILYAHQEAMRLERYDDATYFYDVI